MPPAKRSWRIRASSGDVSAVARLGGNQTGAAHLLQPAANRGGGATLSGVGAGGAAVAAGLGAAAMQNGNDSGIWSRSLAFDLNTIGRYSTNNPHAGVAVRCIKNAE